MANGLGRRGNQVYCLACSRVVLTLSDDPEDWITDGFKALDFHKCSPGVEEEGESNSGEQRRGRESVTGVRAAP